MSLTKDLQARAAQSINKYPETTHSIMNNGIQQLRDAGLVKKSLKTGDKIPKYY